MKTLLNFTGTALFVVAIYFLLKFLFFCLDWGGTKGIVFFGEIKEKMNPFWFWLLFAFFGIAILIILWFLFKYISLFIIALLARLCPYKTFAIWATGIMSVAYSCFFLYHYWFLDDPSLGFRDVMFGLILTCVCIQLCISLVDGVILSNKIEVE
jgi:hypothetical protein